MDVFYEGLLEIVVSFLILHQKNLKISKTYKIREKKQFRYIIKTNIYLFLKNTQNRSFY